MTYTSNILPGTTHVWLTVEQYLNDHHAIYDWLAYDRPSGRVDVFAWQDDDYLDHFHVCAHGMDTGDALRSYVAPCNDALSDWKDMIEDNGDEPAMLLHAFEDQSSALLFKLTFGGA